MDEQTYAAAQKRLSEEIAELAGQLATIGRGDAQRGPYIDQVLSLAEQITKLSDARTALTDERGRDSPHESDRP